MNKIDLINTLKGHDLTYGWDMVCCFHQEKINKMLSVEYSAKQLTEEIPIHEEIPAGLVPGNAIYDGCIRLKAPVISFLADNKCEIKMDVESGRITQTCMGYTNEVSFDPDAWLVTGILSLSAISGNMEAVNLAVAQGSCDQEKTASHEPGTVITFDGSPQGSKMLVYLDFSTLENSLTLQKKSSEDSAAKTDPFLIERVRVAVSNWLQNEVNSLHYILGGIADVPKETKETINLYPKSCLFCTQKTAAGSSLNIYMQISDSLTGSGTYSGAIGSESVQFPDEKLMSCPLPSDVTAMAAISKRLLLNLYIQKSCKEKGWTAKIDSTFSNSGLKFLLTNSAVTIHAEDIYHTSSCCSLFTSSSHNGFDIDFKSVPIELIFENQAGRFHWSHSSDISYEDNLTTWGAGSPVVHAETSSGNFTYTISCDKSVNLSASQDSQVQMSFSIGRDDYTLSSTINKAKKTNYASILFVPIPITVNDEEHARDVISSIDTEVKNKLPSFSFDFGELNLFFAANLLFPGKHTFSIQPTDAFGFPGDLMVFGDISLPDSETKENP